MAPLRALSPLLALFLRLSSASTSLTSSDGSLFSNPHEPHYQTAVLAPLLMNLGFQELAMAVPAFYSPVLSSWSGPITLFAPSDESIRSCPSCSTPRLLREHLVPGLYSRSYLSKLSFDTKLETGSPGRCISVATINASTSDENPFGVKIFVGGVEITRPDLFNDGRIIIHGIQGIISPLSPLSCLQDHSSHFSTTETPYALPAANHPATAIMHMMLRDSIIRLRDSGYSILSLAMRVKFAELAGLNNMTIFTLDDSTIFAGGHGYLNDFRFHVVPNRVLMRDNLMNLPKGTVLPTLVRGQHLMVTQSSSGLLAGSVRINYVPIKVCNVVYSAKIAVHRISLPFPHFYLADLAMEASSGMADVGILDEPSWTVGGISPAAPPSVSGAVDLDDDNDG